VNLLDYSAAVIPVTLVDKNIDVINENFKPLSAADEEIQSSCQFLLSVCYFLSAKADTIR